MWIRVVTMAREVRRYVVRGDFESLDSDPPDRLVRPDEQTATLEQAESYLDEEQDQTAGTRLQQGNGCRTTGPGEMTAIRHSGTDGGDSVNFATPPATLV